MMLASRDWYITEPCSINQSFRGASNFSGFQVSGLDLSVVNVRSMVLSEVEEDCVFSVARIGKSGRIQDALFVFNVTLDVSGLSCKKITVAPFDDVSGVL